MNPGFPMPTYFPFQFAAMGSHTSKEMCESLVGVANPTTRQKGTETFSPGGVPKRPGVLGTSKSGGVLIDAAEVIVTSEILTDVKLSQGCCADAALGIQRAPANRAANTIPCARLFIWIYSWAATVALQIFQYRARIIHRNFRRRGVLAPIW